MKEGFQVKLTMKRIKFVLTERWYAWEDARWDAMADPSIDMYAEDGQNPYDPAKDIEQPGVGRDRSRECNLQTTDLRQDAFEKGEALLEAGPQAQRVAYLPPGSTSPAGGPEARV